VQNSFEFPIGEIVYWTLHLLSHLPHSQTGIFGESDQGMIKWASEAVQIKGIAEEQWQDDTGIASLQYSGIA
jgi:hypothetical protein